MPRAVKQNVFIVMFGDVRGPTAQGDVMINTTAASAPADSPAHVTLLVNCCM